MGGALCPLELRPVRVRASPETLRVPNDPGRPVGVARQHLTHLQKPVVQPQTMRDSRVLGPRTRLLVCHRLIEILQQQVMLLPQQSI